MVTRQVKLLLLLLTCKLMLIVEAGDAVGSATLKVYGGHLLPAVEKILCID
jgi:hypothetical protein